MTLRLDRPRRVGRRVTRGWIVVSALAIALVAPLPYLIFSLEELAPSGAIAANYADRMNFVQVAFHVHITFGGLALLLSPIQLSRWVRRRVPRLHRWAGRVTIGAILLAGPAGAVLATTNLAGPIGVAGFGLLAVLWTGFAVTALVKIRQGDVAAHRRWAIRTFALTYAAVTLRVYLLAFSLGQGALGLDDTGFDPYVLMPFLCWVPNLLLAQWYLTRHAPQSVPRPTSARATLPRPGRPSGSLARGR